MAQKKSPITVGAGRSTGAGTMSANSRLPSPKAVNTAGEPDLTDVEREIIGALTDFRNTLRDRTPLQTKYTIRTVTVVVPPPQLGPDDVRKTREALGVSQPVFADLLGTSASTIRSWEQGQKPPSPMARRFLGLIASDLPYWKSQFRAMVQIRNEEPDASGVLAVPSGVEGDRPSGAAHHNKRSGIVTKKVADKKAASKVRS